MQEEKRNTKNQELWLSTIPVSLFLPFDWCKIKD